MFKFIHADANQKLCSARFVKQKMNGSYLLPSNDGPMINGAENTVYWRKWQCICCWNLGGSLVWWRHTHKTRELEYWTSFSIAYWNFLKSITPQIAPFSGRASLIDQKVLTILRRKNRLDWVHILFAILFAFAKHRSHVVNGNFSSIFGVSFEALSWLYHLLLFEFVTI